VKKRAKNSIVTIDLYNNKRYKFADGKFEVFKKLKFTNRDIIVSYLANSALIVESMDFSLNLSQDDILEVATNKAYEELKLDTATKYKITPVKTAIGAKNNKYQTLISDISSLIKKLQPITSKRKIIDYVIPAPLLYNILYYKNKLPSEGCDMYVYFGEEDTFVTFYYRGKYLYSKSTKYSLSYMYERVCQLAQEVFLTKEQFYKILKSDGLKNSEGKIKDLLIQVFNECFLNLNDILIYTKRVYDIDVVNKAYIGFSCGYLSGIDSYVRNYLNLNTYPISSIYSSSDPAKSIDVLHSLMVMNALEAQGGLYDIVNITPYPKPEPISKRPSGKLLFGGIAVASVFLLPSLYDGITGGTLQISNISLSSKEEQLNSVVTKYKQILKEKRTRLKALTSAKDKLTKVYNTKMGELGKVYSKKFNYKLRSEQLALITQVLTQFDVKSKNIIISDLLYTIELESRDDKELTAFIKKLVSKFDKAIVGVNIKSIKFDKADQLYKGVFNVEFSKDAL